MNPLAIQATAAGAASFFNNLYGGMSPPNMATSSPFDAFTVDNSGWAVNFGSGSASATPNPVSNLAAGLANAASGATTGINLNNPFVLLGIAAIVIVIVKRK